jgi:site-specific DNA recombinase
MKIKAVVINRISDELQKDGYSLDAQSRSGKKFCADKNMEVLREFTFQETASKATARKQFQEILSLLWTNPSGIKLVVEKRDRLIRNFEDRQAIKALVQQGLEVFFYKENRVLNKYSQPEEWLVDGIMTSVNEYQSTNIGREAIKGMTEKAMQGWAPSKAWFGYYNHIPEERRNARRRRGGTIELHDWGRKLYRRMFELRMQYPPMPLHRICEEVLSEDILPPDLKRVLHVGTVEKILKQPAYAGKFYFRGQLYDGKHEAIITWREWQLLQETFGKNNPRGPTKKMGLFSGLLRCAECGCQITYDPKTKPSGRTYHYYRCSNMRRFHDKLVNAKEADILNQLSNVVELINIPREWAQQVADAMRATHEEAKRARKEQIAGYKSRLQALEGQEDVIYEDFKKGIISEDKYKRDLKRVRELRAEMTDWLDRNHDEIDDAYIDTVESIFELCSSAKSLLESRSERERLKFLQQFYSNSRLRGLTLEYDLRSPFDVIAKMREVSNWRPLRDLNSCLLREREMS